MCLILREYFCFPAFVVCWLFFPPHLFSRSAILCCFTAKCRFLPLSLRRMHNLSRFGCAVQCEGRRLLLRRSLNANCKRSSMFAFVLGWKFDIPLVMLCLKTFCLLNKSVGFSCAFTQRGEEQRCWRNEWSETAWKQCTRKAPNVDFFYFFLLKTLYFLLSRTYFHLFPSWR